MDIDRFILHSILSTLELAIPNGVYVHSHSKYNQNTLFYTRCACLIKVKNIRKLVFVNTFAWLPWPGFWLIKVTAKSG